MVERYHPQYEPPDSHLPRPSWPERFQLLAEQWAQYSTCLRRHVGAVIWDPATKAVVSIGYNDTPIGKPDCGDGACIPCQGNVSVSNNDACLCLHAETNALLLAARRGTKTENCWIYSTYRVCPSCQKSLDQAGIAVYDQRG